MMELARVQREFAAAVLDPERTPPSCIESGQEAGRRLARFNIYRNNSFVALIDALEARFPVASRLTGSEFFRAMARVYVSREPPGRALLSYGGSFPSFLDDFEPVRDTPYLPDVARLEWARHESYYAADAAPLTAAAFARLRPSANAVLRLHPAARVQSSPYPIHTIWELNARARDPLPSILPNHGQSVLITRPADNVAVREVGHDAARFILAVASQCSIAYAYEHARKAAPRFSLEGALRDLLSSGAIAGVDIANSSRTEEE